MHNSNLCCSRVNCTQYCGELAKTGHSLEFLTLKFVCSEQLINYSLGFPTPDWLSWRFLHVGFCSNKL